MSGCQLQQWSQGGLGIKHWWGSEPRNEARYQPGVVYEARTPEGGLRGSYQGSYEARISLVYEARTGIRVRGSYTRLIFAPARLVYEPDN